MLDKWKNECNKLDEKYPELDFEIEHFVIEVTVYEKIEPYIPPDMDDYSQVADKTGAIGYILTIKQKDK